MVQYNSLEFSCNLGLLKGIFTKIDSLHGVSLKGQERAHFILKTRDGQTVRISCHCLIKLQAPAGVWLLGTLLLCPCLFRPSDNMWRSQRADAPQCAHFPTVISRSWITEQISVGKCAHQGASGAPNKFQNCHLDKTNMDKTSQHRL